MVLPYRFDLENVSSFSFANLRDIASLKAIDINERLKAPDDFSNTIKGNTNATFR